MHRWRLRIRRRYARKGQKDFGSSGSSEDETLGRSKGRARLWVGPVLKRMSQLREGASWQVSSLQLLQMLTRS